MNEAAVEVLFCSFLHPLPTADQRLFEILFFMKNPSHEPGKISPLCLLVTNFEVLV